MPKGHRSDQGGSKFKHVKSKTKHQKKRFIRDEDPFIAVFMWGIQHSINELNMASQPCLLLPEDFKAYSKIRVENQYYNKENLPGHFKFKDYCPWVFHDLRKKFGMDDSEYMHSLVDQSPHPVENQGRSGANFYYSYDQKLVMKSMNPEEMDLLHQILMQYHAYVVTQEGKTFLPHLLGLYRVTVNNAETYWIVMRNVLSASVHVHKKFDLKGSTVDRTASDKEKAKSSPTLKDNDFIVSVGKICIGETAKEQFMAVMEADVHLLESLNLMDYSLLVGIHDPSIPPEPDVSNGNDDDEEEGAGVETWEDDSKDAGRKSEDECISDDNDEPLESPLSPPRKNHLTGSVEGLDSPESPNASSDDQPPHDASELHAPARPSLDLTNPPQEEGGSLKSPGTTGACVTFTLPPAQQDNTPSERMYPVIGKSVDVFAIPSGPGEKRYIYYMGIIDILTNYGAMKRAAHAAKTVKHGAGAEISTVKPEQYARRFLEFLSKSMQ